MKKGIQESNPVLALWHRIVLDGRILKLATECREKVDIPKNGFSSSTEVDIWYKKTRDKNFNLIVESNIKLFIKKMKGVAPYEGIVSEMTFEMLMLEFLMYKKIEDEYFSSFSSDGMNTYVIKNGKTYNRLAKEFLADIDDGIYIKINPFSSIEKIIKFIENKKKTIRSNQEFYIKKEKLQKPKKIKLSSNFRRDSTILTIGDEWSKKEIESNFNIKADYKEQAISNLMKAMGFKKVTPQIVKAVKQRRKIK